MAAFCLVLMGLAPAAPDFGSYWKPNGKHYEEGPPFTKAMGWAIGQYVTYGTTVKGERKSLSRTLVAGKEGGLWWMEIWSLDSEGKESLIELSISGYEDARETGDMKRLTLEGVRVRDGKGKVVVVDRKQLALFGDSFSRGIAAMLGLELPAALSPGGQAVVPAGVFLDTRCGKSSFASPLRKLEFTNWYSSAVPLSGAVRTLSEDGQTLTELLAFGFDGKARAF